MASTSSSIHLQEETPTTTIHQCKIELVLLTKKLNHLKNLEETLRKSIDITKEEWKFKTNEINKLKLTINQLTQKYSNKSLIKLLKQKIIKRQNKRARIKRRNTKLKLQKLTLLKNRQKLHKEIDEWIKNEKDKDLKILEREEQKKQTEFILSGITKKKFEAQRYIEVLNLLKELRKIRKTATIAQHKNDFNEKQFEIKINQLINVWKDALQEYENEEKQLKLLLSNKIKTVEEEWLECLFGNYSENEAIQIKSEQNLNSFLEIRRTWDSYCVPEDSSYGSSIPVGWVMPNENPSNKWKPYRNYDCSVKEDITMDS